MLYILYLVSIVCYVAVFTVNLSIIKKKLSLRLLKGFNPPPPLKKAAEIRRVLFCHIIHNDMSSSEVYSCDWQLYLSSCDLELLFKWNEGTSFFAKL